MEQPTFLAGHEKRFFDFLANLNDKDKIALLTHTDLDGIASGKVANKVIDANLVKFIDYIDLNSELIKELKDKKINKLIITDIAIGNPNFIKEAEKHFEMLIIDHHTFKEDYNSERTVFMNAHHFCAAYLCYYLFSKSQDITKLDWLVACASISDWAYFNNKEFMTSTFEKYQDEFKFEGDIIRKKGKFWDTQWALTLAIIYHKKDLTFVLNSVGENFEIGNLKESYSIVQKEVNEALEKFEKEKIGFNEGYFWEFNPERRIGSLVSTLISTRYLDKTIIIGRPGDKYYSFSARRQDKKISMAEFLQKLASGLEDSDAGGHIPAAGGHVLMKDKEIIKERLSKL
ncbi:MAG: DHH family phosphoesterase [archaeon]